MRKFLFSLSFFFFLSLCGCLVPISGALSNNEVETLKGWSFQFNEGTNDYSIFFGLLNKNGAFISADVNVDIRIVNENDEEVYKETKSVSTQDFNYYTSQAAGEQYLANVRIPATDVASGTSSDGKVFLTVYQPDGASFDEVSCDALLCLPVSDITLSTGLLPVKLDVKGFDGATESVIQINEVSYQYEKDIMPQLNVTVYGEKTYGSANSIGYDIIRYKLFDSNGNMVEAHDIFLNALDEGDKFKDDSIVIYDVVPGEAYTLKFVEYGR